MAELSAVPFDKLPPTGDGYTVLYDNNQVCRSDKKLSELVGARTSSFLTKEEGDSLYQEKGDYLVEDDITGKLDKEQYANDSATFLTAHQNLDEYATMEWVEEHNYISGVDLTNYYTKSETSGKEEIEAALEEKQDKLTFAGTSNTITSINNSAIAGGGAGVSNSWKQLSEDNHSSGEITGGKFCVYIGKYNSGYNDSYTMGRENYSERGVNIGYANKINVETTEILPGNVNIGKENVVLDAGAINIGQNNSAKDFGVNIGEHSIATSGSYNIGDSDIAKNASINIGESNSADIGSYNIGQFNSAYKAGYTFGQTNIASIGSISIGLHNSALNAGYVLGSNSYAHNGAASIGVNCTANNGSFSIGSDTSASDGSVIMGEHISAIEGSVAIGTQITAAAGAVCLGNNINVKGGCIAIGARNRKVDYGCQVVGDENTAFRGSTQIGIKNYSIYSTILGNRNDIDNLVLSNSAISSEYYNKPSFVYYLPPEEIYIKNFVAGLDNTGLYAKNTYILGHYNKITCESSADYLNPNNDGFTFIYGMRNSADRNWDMSIGYKSIASGGENIAIGVPFQTITGYYNDEGTLSPVTGITNTLAKGYKNFALRGNVTGISNTAINSNLTGEYVGDELGHVTANKLSNSFVSATTKVTYNDQDYYGYMLNNIIENSNVLLTGQYINDNQLTNAAKLNVSAESFSFNKFYHTEKVNLTGSHIDTNTFLHTNSLNIESDNICRNIILNCAESYSAKITASKIFSDNIIAKTDFAATGNSISSINENVIFNSYINGSATQKYISWDTYNDCNFTRNFLFGSYLGNYIYNTFSFCDNSNRYSEFKLENTIRVFNFGDNTINKSENSFVFGDENKTSAIARTFVFGKRNNINKTNLTNDSQDYVNDIFVFGYENNVIADNDNVTYPILERNRIFGIHNYIKSSEHLNDNLIVGNNNSISYNTTKPTKTSILQNVNFPDNPYYTSELQSAAFATYRNNILGNGNRVSQCITDSLIVGAGNYVFDTTEHTPNMTADYNSIYTLGVGNVAYDGSNQINIGYNNETSGHFAEAIGDGIVAKGQQLIIGKCNAIVDNTNRYSIEYDSSTSSIKNVEQSGVIFAIGNGTYDYTTAQYTDRWGYLVTGYLDKNKNEIPSANVNNEEYITRSNALIVSANGVVSANNYKTSAGYVVTETELSSIIQRLEDKITALETIISSNSANWVLTSQA